MPMLSRSDYFIMFATYDLALVIVIPVLAVKAS